MALTGFRDSVHNKLTNGNAAYFGWADGKRYYIAMLRDADGETTPVKIAARKRDGEWVGFGKMTVTSGPEIDRYVSQYTIRFADPDEWRPLAAAVEDEHGLPWE